MRHLLATLLCLAALPAYALDTAAKHAYMVDMNTHAVLLNKEGEVQMHPSSMSKLMTTYLLFDRLAQGRIKLEDRFPISEKAWRMQGSKTFVKVGDTISVEELIRGIIIQSGNDACIVAAEGLSGSEEEFVREMNATAQKLGMMQSHFVNATGWPDEEHLMSARDLAILAEHIIRDHAQYYHYYSERGYSFGGITQPNRNRLLGTSGIDGLKTGHTDVAGYGITLSAEQAGRRLILVINGLESDNARVEEGGRLMAWGFREFTNKTLVKAGQRVAEAQVWFGEQPSVPLVADADVTITMKAGAADQTKFTLVYEGPIPAPIAKGAHIADLVVDMPEGGRQVIPLQAAQDVECLGAFRRFFATLHRLIFKN